MGPDVFDPVGGSRPVIEMLADPWLVLVIYALGDRQLRFRQIEQRVDGISQKVLMQTLRKTTRHRLVEAVPDGDGYRLTDLGQALLEEVVAPLCTWAQDHVEHVQPRPRASGGGCAPPRA
jgi:DNA-binding HxlR family transcriptional regulator